MKGVKVMDTYSNPGSYLLNIEAIVSCISFFSLFSIFITFNFVFMVTKVFRSKNKILMKLKNNGWVILQAAATLVLLIWVIIIIIIHVIAFFTTSKIDFGNDTITILN